MNRTLIAASITAFTLGLGACGGDALTDNDQAVCAAAKTPNGSDEDTARAIFGAVKADNKDIRAQQERIQEGTEPESDLDAAAQILKLCKG